MEEKKPGFIRRNFRRLMTLLSTLRIVVTNLLFLVVLGVLFLAFSGGEIPTIPGKGALVLNIQGSLVDQKNYVDPLVRIMGESDPSQYETLLQDVIDAIDYGREDERITTLVLSLDDMMYGGIAKMQELAPALQRFRDSGKKIIAVGDNYLQDQYWLAAQADEIYINPNGAVLIDGYGLYRNYFKQALEKLHIDFHVFRVGEYKSAMEPYIRNDMSTEAKQANQVWLGALWDEYVVGVAERRSFSKADLNQYINQFDQRLADYQGNTSSAAMAAGLIDGIKTRDEINRYLVDVVGAVDEDGNYQGIGFERYLWVKNIELSEAAESARVGVIVAAGNIVDGEQAPGAIGGDTLASLIREARRDATIRAVVLRIDSGGGSAFASEIIRQELLLLKAEGKPLVVSMGGMAASGGYWIAADADEIWALPSTLTGSIGIFGAFPTLDKSLAALGITTDGVGTTNMAGAMRIDRPLQPIAARSIQSILERGYAQFITIVAEGRELPKSEVEGLAKGRVWSGKDAQRLGLVDQLGTLDQAIASAAALAELDAYEKQLIDIPLTPQEQFLRELTGEVELRGLMLAGGIDTRFLKQAQQWLAPFKGALSFANSMNDPQGLYLHCSNCMAP
ncbi:signal peptide peptidase SppA [Oceanicoccus sagamiensis]|uniref:Signal peptide peptidase SppA n=1 Tax=Oceanicoccus sagamiensis TaxID=716816 RepID=A0A1X9NEP0_9GAMM|nr:signal peptide peptidase SppA [Oceanicoccus sagamiensis]ARN74902.1 signal peptide peptidase SppA [Oceanicoccus sagamiensis]